MKGCECEDPDGVLDEVLGLSLDSGKTLSDEGFVAAQENPVADPADEEVGGFAPPFLASLP